ncbi:helix-turn-helix transcriptional regulator [Neobacillus sp. WH10]|uniref:helix-turn-helix domain-containing protein n=1 Tax=Neobacillus sp. WH10 TaxID=3047873 RepID=UPI0024C1F784|nr:helix-turn-helix transcriptional regulator [Neobacillus sp. WH10]WHY77356.1 helix-turn-helix transcriptional regulator [Neobacillus sp. WH10]
MKNQRIAHIGKALKKARRKRKITQEQLAKRCSIPRPYISIIESGIKQPKLRIIFSLAEGLGMKASDLVKEIEEYLVEYSYVS